MRGPPSRTPAAYGTRETGELLDGRDLLLQQQGYLARVEAGVPLLFGLRLGSLPVPGVGAQPGCGVLVPPPALFLRASGQAVGAGAGAAAAAMGVRGARMRKSPSQTTGARAIVASTSPLRPRRSVPAVRAWPTERMKAAKLA